MTNTTTLDSLAKLVDPKTAARFAEQKAAGVVNPIVLAKLMEVKPQMLYQYIAKGKLPIVEGHTAVGLNSTQKKTIDLAVAETFASNYFGRKQEREAKKAAAIEAELAGETVS